MNDVVGGAWRRAERIATQAMRTIRLAHATDLAGFRTAARTLVQANVAPAHVHWVVAASQSAGATTDLFDTHAEQAPVEGQPHGLDGLALLRAAPAVPRSFVADCDRLVLHSDPARFALMYRLLWRHSHEPGLRHDALDSDRQLARHMVHSVSRDMHKMRAFVRFREVQDEGGGAEGAGGNADKSTTVHVAWFEPDHHIVQANAGFFARRFAGMRWAILTPECSLRWDGKKLDVGPGAQRSDAPPADAGEALWLTYYRHIFNPARLKLDMMRKEMPRRYWHNLPEAQLIGEMAQTALQRSADMVAAEASIPRRRIVPLVVEGAAAVRHAEHALAHANFQDRELSGRSSPDHKYVGGERSDGELLGHARPGSVHPHAVPQSLRPLQQLHHLRAQAEACRACPIGAHATQAVPGVGPLHAQRMLVGEQPGDNEDLQGQPFVGPAGQLLNRAMADLGWQREALYLTNAVKHFKYVPRGRTRLHQKPTVAEMHACGPFLRREIAYVGPQTLLALGATAAHALLGHAVKMEDVRGQWHTGIDGLPVLVAWHPSALLRAQDSDKERMYAEWLIDLAQPVPA